MRQLTIALVVCALALFAGCKKDGEGAGGGAGEAPKGPSTDEQVKALQKVLPEVQAAVPADAPKVEFEVQLNDDEHVIAITPKGWKAGVIPGSFEPPEGSDLGFMTRYSAGSNCDGSCSPKDWKATAEKVDFAQFKGEQFQVTKDEALTEPAGRIVVATADGGKRLYIAAARWKDGASRYSTCRATLDEEAVALAPAFEKACRSNIPLF